MQKLYKAEFDASSRPEDEKSTIGFVIYAPGRKLICRSRRVVDHGSSVEVEYRAFIELLKALLGLGITTVLIKGDCKAVIQQMKGRKEANKRLEDLHAEAEMLYKRFDHCPLKWVPREKNTTANYLSRKSLGTVKRK